MDTDNDPVDYGGTPWYIYECVPFIKDIKGYDENSGSQNKLLENFIKQMNTKPLDMVDEFLTKDKVATSDDTCNGSGSKEKPNKGYLKMKMVTLTHKIIIALLIKPKYILWLKAVLSTFILLTRSQLIICG